MGNCWKIGEIANIAGLTVRTLRYYDQIELLSPSDYSESGHRIYNLTDLSKLQQILSLKYIGLSLKEINVYLSESQSKDTSQILSVQIERLKESIRVEQNLLKNLNNALVFSESQKDLSIEQVTKLLGAMKMNREKYFNEKQLDQIKNQYANFDKKTLDKEMKEFNIILDNIREHMNKGTNPTNSDVQNLATQWQEKINKFIPKNDPSFMKATEKFHSENPENELQQGIDKELYLYINKVLQNK